MQHLFRVLDDLVHVMTRTVAQPFQGGFQRFCPSSAEPGADYFKRHDSPLPKDQENIFPISISVHDIHRADPKKSQGLNGRLIRHSRNLQS
jgi:hypothetical protein